MKGELVLWFISLVYCDGRTTKKETTTTPNPEYEELTFVRCRERYHLLASRERDEMDFELDDRQPKLWYFQPRFGGQSPKEMVFDLHSEDEDNRVFVRPDHTMVIRRVKDSDSGFYYCHGAKGEDSDRKFNFMVDVIRASVSIVMGNIAKWQDFSATVYQSVNDELRVERLKGLETARSEGIRLTVRAEWTPWSPCNGCASLRRKIAECRVKPENGSMGVVEMVPTSEVTQSLTWTTPSVHIATEYTSGSYTKIKMSTTSMHNTTTETIQSSTLTTNITQIMSEISLIGAANGTISTTKSSTEALNKTTPMMNSSLATYNLSIKDVKKTTKIATTTTRTAKIVTGDALSLLHSYELSCHSLDFARLFPELSEVVKKVSDFVLTESCYAPCQEFRGEDRTQPKYKNVVTLEEGDHISLICPDANQFESKVVWRRDGVLLDVGSFEGNDTRSHIYLDNFSNLYISYARVDESGNYTCYVNDVKIQEIIVIVKAESIMQTAAFHRHLQYLGFMLLFGVIFYAAGVIIAWTRRRTFKQIHFPDSDENLEYLFVNNKRGEKAIIEKRTYSIHSESDS